MNTCAKCSMPIEADTACSCNPSLCYRCCECSDDCTCGCSNMNMVTEAEEENIEDGEEDIDDDYE